MQGEDEVGGERRKKKGRKVRKREEREIGMKKTKEEIKGEDSRRKGRREMDEENKNKDEEGGA